jgi:hypothetical protein
MLTFVLTGGNVNKMESARGTALSSLSLPRTSRVAVLGQPRGEHMCK